jgi:hypothetical protein
MYDHTKCLAHASGFAAQTVGECAPGSGLKQGRGQAPEDGERKKLQEGRGGPGIKGEPEVVGNTQEGRSQGLEGRKPQRLLVEGHRVGTASPGAERSSEGVSESAAPFLNSYHGCENLLLAFHNENLDL